MGRIRKIKNASSLIKEYEWLLQTYKVQYFNNHNPIHLEIGAGKGNFIIQSALKYSNINFVGIEKDSSIVLKVLRKLKMCDQKITNLLIINDDAKNLLNWFPSNSISKIFLNFSDPWPKKRHEKNRLVYKDFLVIYYELLIRNGMIEIKTDNTVFYEYALESLAQYKKFQICYKTEDLYKEINDDNIQTEYESKFIQQNKPIYKIILKKI